ncbi:hypothetical protein CXIVA_04430 [Clostridium sp. SY8519]|uniref:hypothetical protein n=1 Tax=Clostridium sp. (strain SY8519) TaxID=1042156 RepID=UPI0002171B12|nr:hypothetical protein [Clostridium sp. SY8519]BAK46410.1 hypothetical protein CXIVA_04430 [Clostridium sp. SY8519]
MENNHKYDKNENTKYIKIEKTAYQGDTDVGFSKKRLWHAIRNVPSIPVGAKLPEAPDYIFDKR